MTMDRKMWGAAALAALGCCASAPAFAAEAPAYVTAAIADPARPVWQRARDADLKPAEVMTFAGVKPGDIAVDFIPGYGYYTRILSPIVGKTGKLYSLVPLPGGVRDGEMVRQMEAEAIAAGQPPIHNPVDDALAIMNFAHYANDTVLWQMLYQYGGQFAVPDQVDFVLNAGSYHDLQKKVYGDMGMVAENKAIFLAMKPGGIYVVIDYKGGDGAGDRANAVGRSDETSVKQQIMAAGFVLDGESQALIKASDDLAAPVPKPQYPGPAAGDKASQFVLRFKKPANASGATLRPKNDPLAGRYENTEIGNMLAKGDVSGNRPRWNYYHADGTYEEMGPTNPLQEGTWFWDAAGHNCEIHQYPSTQRQFIVCHVIEAHKVGDVWGSGTNVDGTPHRNEIVKGFVYPPLPKPEEITKGF